MIKQNSRLALLLLLLTFLAACRNKLQTTTPVATGPTPAIAAYQNPDLPTADRIDG
jgi:hypothetical protein